MSAEEIVRGLRTSTPKCYPINCDRCTGVIDSLDCDYFVAQKAADLIESLTAQLAASQQETRAAVEDLEGAGACFSCKHFRRNGGDCFGAGRCRLDGIEIWPCNKPGVYRAEVPDDGRKTYEWRGPQTAKEESKP